MPTTDNYNAYSNFPVVGFVVGLATFSVNTAKLVRDGISKIFKERVFKEKLDYVRGEVRFNHDQKIQQDLRYMAVGLARMIFFVGGVIAQKIYQAEQAEVYKRLTSGKITEVYDDDQSGEPETLLNKVIRDGLVDIGTIIVNIVKGDLSKVHTDTKLLSVDKTPIHTALKENNPVAAAALIRKMTSLGLKNELNGVNKRGIDKGAQGRVTLLEYANSREMSDVVDALMKGLGEDAYEHPPLTSGDITPYERYVSQQIKGGRGDIVTNISDRVLQVLHQREPLIKKAMTPICEAFKKNDFHLVKTIITRIPDASVVGEINSRGIDGASLIDALVGKGQLDVAVEIMKRLKDIPLNDATRASYTKVIHAVIDIEGSDDNSVTMANVIEALSKEQLDALHSDNDLLEKLNTPFQHALKNGKVKSVMLLIPAISKKVLSLVNARGVDGKPAIDYAREKKYNEVEQKILPLLKDVAFKGANAVHRINSIIERAVAGIDPVEVLKSLSIDEIKKISMNSGYLEDGITPLQTAVKHDHKGVVTYLLDNLPEDLLELAMKGKLEGNSLFEYAVRNKKCKALSCFLKKYIKKDCSLELPPNFLKKIASGKREIPIDIWKMILKNVPRNTFDAEAYEGRPLFHYMAIAGKGDLLIACLEEYGNDILELEDDAGNTPFHYAFGKINDEPSITDIVSRASVQVLVKPAKGYSNRTQLHRALIQNNERWEKALKDAISERLASEGVSDSDKILIRASLQAADGEGVTPFHTALSGARNEFMKWLIQETGMNLWAGGEKTPVHMLMGLSGVEDKLIRYKHDRVLGLNLLDALKLLHVYDSKRNEIESMPLWLAMKSKNVSLFRTVVSYLGTDVIKDLAGHKAKGWGKDWLTGHYTIPGYTNPFIETVRSHGKVSDPNCPYHAMARILEDAVTAE
jgi:ankyrin repeat protein